MVFECRCAEHRANGTRTSTITTECIVHVDCDEWCNALRDPVTVIQVCAALAHWRDHVYLSGCSHGC